MIGMNRTGNGALAMNVETIFEPFTLISIRISTRSQRPVTIYHITHISITTHIYLIGPDGIVVSTVYFWRLMAHARRKIRRVGGPDEAAAGEQPDHNGLDEYNN